MSVSGDDSFDFDASLRLTAGIVLLVSETEGNKTLRMVVQYQSDILESLSHCQLSIVTVDADDEAQQTQRGGLLYSVCMQLPGVTL